MHLRKCVYGSSIILIPFSNYLNNFVISFINMIHSKYNNTKYIALFLEVVLYYSSIINSF
jgi:hypothetical protein